MRGSTVLDATDLRIAAGAMLGAAVLLPAASIDGVPCPFRSLTGIPCPLCGMTTSVVAAVHGYVAASIAASPAGLLVLVVAGWLLVARRSTVRIPALAPAALLLVMWVYQLFRFSVMA